MITVKTFKALLTFIILQCLATTAIAQNDLRKQFQARVDSITMQYKQYYKEGRYKEEEVPLKEIITMLDTVTFDNPSYLKAYFKDQKANTQYDLACCYALQGKKEQALQELEVSANNGYNNYSSMVNEKDLISLHKHKKYKKSLEIVKSHSKLELLRKANPYKVEANSSIPEFTYESPKDQNLAYVRNYFKLDTISGKDNELEHIKNILHFVHDQIPHDGSSFVTCALTAIDLYNYSKATGKGINCWNLSIVLSDMYLAMGYKARVVICMPANPDDYDNHVITAVWSNTLKKWLYVDPTMDAWVMDENGTMLSIAEVREHLINGKPLVLCETANWSHKSKQTKEEYLDNYMAKNLYYFVCKNLNFFDMESLYRNTGYQYIRLLPSGFETTKFNNAVTTTDPNVFWAAPK